MQYHTSSYGALNERVGYIATTMFPATATRDGTEYVFRQFQPRDVDGYLSLYERVWGARHSPAWFRWRFLENPYVDHVPVFVATADGDVVATRPFFALRMAVGDAETLALLTVDTMVHPDHRRRGLFTTLTEKSIQWYAPREPTFVFNQPAAAARPGFASLGWRELGPSVNFHRTQRPGALLTKHVARGRTLPPLLPAVVAPLVQAVRGVSGALRREDAVAVRDRPGVQVETLASLYRRQSDAVHAVRDEAYYRWRFASPEWSRRTYLADGGAETVGALVRTRTTHEDVTVTQVADLVPATGGEDWSTAVASLLGRAIADHRDSDVLSIPEGVVPSEILLRLGFLPDDRLPLSLFSKNDSVLCVRPLVGDQQALDTEPLYDPDAWLLGYGERDTV